MEQDACEEEVATKPQMTPPARKHGRESTANGLGLDIANPAPAAKRIRRSHGPEIATNGEKIEIGPNQNGDGEQQDSEMPEPTSPSCSAGQDDEKSEDMDVDGGHAPEQARMTPTLTNGHSVGVQSDKVAELGPETTLLTVPDGKHVIHTAWNPRDPNILAVAGEALARIWTIATTSNRSQSPHLAQPADYRDLLDPFETALVTTIAWSPNGEVLAMATKDGQKGAVVQIGLVSLFSKRGTSIDELSNTEDGIISFNWSPNGKLLLGIISSGEVESTLLVWNVENPEIKSHLKFDAIVRDAAWTDQSHFVVCGHDIIGYCSFDGQNLVLARNRAEKERAHRWSHVRFDHATRTTAIVAEEESVLAVISSSDELFTTTAHEEEITALEYRPIPNVLSLSPLSPCLLATSALDGKIKLWDAQKPFNLVTILELGKETPPMAISFTPDGYLVAAANWNKVLIWNPEYSNTPKASWKGELGHWQSLATNGLDHDSGIGEEDEQIPQHSLSWDADGGKLAFGLRNQVILSVAFFEVVT